MPHNLSWKTGTCWLSKIYKYVYARMQTQLRVLYTRAKFDKVYRNFFYSPATKRFTHIRRAKHINVFPRTVTNLKIISSWCDACRRFKVRPRKSCDSFEAERIPFSRRILLNGIYIKNCPVLKAVDEHTHFLAIRFLLGVSNKQFETLLMSSDVSAILKYQICCWSTRAPLLEMLSLCMEGFPSLIYCWSLLSLTTHSASARIITSLLERPVRRAVTLIPHP